MKLILCLLWLPSLLLGGGKGGGFRGYKEGYILGQDSKART